MAIHPTPVLSHADDLETLDPVQVRGPTDAPTRPRRPKPKTRRPAEVLTDAEVRAPWPSAGTGLSESGTGHCWP